MHPVWHRTVITEVQIMPSRSRNHLFKVPEWQVGGNIYKLAKGDSCWNCLPIEIAACLSVTISVVPWSMYEDQFCPSIHWFTSGVVYNRKKSGEIESCREDFGDMKKDKTRTSPSLFALLVSVRKRSLRTFCRPGLNVYLISKYIRWIMTTYWAPVFSVTALSQWKAQMEGCKTGGLYSWEKEGDNVNSFAADACVIIWVRWVATAKVLHLMEDIIMYLFEVFLCSVSLELMFRGLKGSGAVMVHLHHCPVEMRPSKRHPPSQTTITHRKCSLSKSSGRPWSQRFA